LTDVVIFDRHLYRYFKGSYALEREVKTAFLYFLFFDKNAEHFVIFEKKTVEQWKVLPEQSLF